MEASDIILRKIIVHILDTSLEAPVISAGLIPTDKENLNAFLHKHIFKLLTSDEKKNCVFYEEDSEVYQLLKDFKEENLKEVSEQMAYKLFGIMKQNPSIPSADFVAVTYQYRSEPYLALLKMNYRENYVHYTRQTDGEQLNDIILQRAALPSGKLSEAVLIDLTDKSMSVIEKKYEINGEKENYLSSMFLNCHVKRSPKTKLKAVDKVIKEVNQEFFEEDVEKQMEVKSILEREFREEGSIQTEEIGEKLYGEQPDIKEVFEEKLEKYHMNHQEVKPENHQTVKMYEKQHLKTDTGIEIDIPMEQYNNPDCFEFISNEDGTISMLIKNISRLTSH